VLSVCRVHTHVYVCVCLIHTPSSTAGRLAPAIRELPEAQRSCLLLLLPWRLELLPCHASPTGCPTGCLAHTTDLKCEGGAARQGALCCAVLCCAVLCWPGVTVACRALCVCVCGREVWSACVCVCAQAQAQALL
jgi:hypothetical protein